MKRRDLLVTVVIIACALGSILYVSPTLLRPPATTGATHVVEYGLHYSPYLFDSINNDLVTDLRPQWLRVIAPLHPSSWPSNVTYPNYEKLMKAFPNVNILMIIGSGTMGADEEGCTYSHLKTFPKGWINAEISSCGWSLQDWDANVTGLVKAFANVHAWEIWSEPDFVESGYLCCDNNVTLLARHYFDMLRDAYQIIKAHNPNDIVIAYSVHLYNRGGAKGDWTKQFMEEVWKLGASNYCDAVSFWAYPEDYPSYNVDRPGSTWQAPLAAFEALTHKPVWVIVNGIASNDANSGGTPETQATYLTQSFTFLSQVSYVKVVIWSYVYNPSAFYDCSLLTRAPVSQQTPKPAYYAFQNFTKKQTTTATST
jgi:hypothetical protein